MRAAQLVEFGGAEAVQVNEVEQPHPGAGQIRIAVRAASVNGIDWKFRSGAVKPKSLPMTMGFDVAGVVDDIGDGVTGVAVGDEVLGPSTGGGFAEYALLDDWTPKPTEMTWGEAAGLVMGAETATRGLDLLGVADGSTVLVNGASGGVGSAAVQLAVGRGATVIAVAAPANADYLRSLGAVPVSYGSDMVGQVRAAAADGVDAAFDVAGSKVLPELVELTGSADAVVTIADYAGAKENGVRFTGGAEGRSWQGMAVAAQLFEQGRYRVEIQQEFPLDQAGAATVLLQDGHVRGKLVITI